MLRVDGGRVKSLDDWLFGLEKSVEIPEYSFSLSEGMLGSSCRGSSCPSLLLVTLSTSWALYLSVAFSFMSSSSILK